MPQRLGGVYGRGRRPVSRVAAAHTLTRFLFGCALDRLLSAEVAINAFSALVLDLHPSRKELTWTPRTGTRSLL